MKVAVTYFHLEVRDLIEGRPIPGDPFGCFRAENVGRARFNGLESSVQFKLLPPLTLDAEYTYLDWHTADGRLPRRPRRRRRRTRRPREKWLTRSCCSSLDWHSYWVPGVAHCAKCCWQPRGCCASWRRPTCATWSPSGYPRSNSILRHLVKGGHSVTCATFSFPLEKDDYLDIPRDVELFDGFRDRGRLFKDYLPNSDIVWISRPHNMAAYFEYLSAYGGNDIRAKLVYYAEGIFSERESLRAQITGQRISSGAILAAGGRGS